MNEYKEQFLKFSENEKLAICYVANKSENNNYHWLNVLITTHGKILMLCNYGNCNDNRVKDECYIEYMDYDFMIPIDYLLILINIITSETKTKYGWVHDHSEIVISLLQSTNQTNVLHTTYNGHYSFILIDIHDKKQHFKKILSYMKKMLSDKNHDMKRKIIEENNIINEISYNLAIEKKQLI